jgi:glycosyltransferase involved in cell wall biosynthesis
LKEHFDVVAVCPEAVDWDGPTVTPGEFHPTPGDVLLHFLGNNPGHLFAYRSALAFGGVAVCHDLMTPHLLGGFAPDEEFADLIEQIGHRGAVSLWQRRARRVATGDEAYFLQVIGRPLRRAEAVVVHSRFAKFAVEAELPEVPVHHIHSHTGAIPDGIVGGADVRARLGMDENAFLVGLFGYLGGHKRVPEALRGIALAADFARGRGIDLRLVVVGAEVAMDVRVAIDNLGLGATATVRGSVDDRAFFEHMAAVDVVVNLRYPTVGETSAVIMQAMELGRPVITTDHAQFSEERAAIRVSPDDDEVDNIAGALVTLATSAALRGRLEEGVRARAAECSLDAAVDNYIGVVESVLARRATDRAPRNTLFADSAPFGKRAEARERRLATPSPSGPTSSNSSA